MSGFQSNQQKQFSGSSFNQSAGVSGGGVPSFGMTNQQTQFQSRTQAPSFSPFGGNNQS